jgi:hypothetical protein
MTDENENDILETETPEQKQFREDMEAAGIKVRTYSGRGMYGRRTYGVTCARGWTGEDGPSEAEVYRATKVDLITDSMGMGTILYLR